jgi:cell division protein FtsN
MKKLYVLLIAGSLLLSFNACNSDKKKPKNKPVKKTVVHKPLVDSARLADSLALIEAQRIAEAEAEAKAAQPDDKYFLISGSFHSMANAEKFQQELQAQGYDSEVIVRKTGPNTDFYKVSYRSFYDRDEAYNALRQEKKMPNNEMVWLLVKY